MLRVMAGAADGVSQNIPQVLCGEGGGMHPSPTDTVGNDYAYTVRL